MRVVVAIVRILLGVAFLVSGADKLFHFFPAQPLPPGAAGQFMGALLSTRYLMFIGLCESIPALLLLANRFVPLALTIVGPVIVNIILTGIFMTHQALLPGLLMAVLWFVVFWSVRSAFAGIFASRAQGYSNARTNRTASADTIAAGR